MNKHNKGFTLIELLVVIAIISLLSSIVLASLNSARAKARDAKRKEEMIQLRTALNMYYLDKGQYPYAYGDATGLRNSWGGVSTAGCGTNGTVSGATAYIIGLTPDYMATLPVDPGTPGLCNGYLYMSDGINYKLLSHFNSNSSNRSGPESYPSAGQAFYDPWRPTWAWMLCSGEPACSTW